VVAEGTGVLLNNELDDFAAKPDAPNAFGLIGLNEANAPAPNKRPLSSMTPTIVFKDGKPVLVTGSPGGSRIITVVLQIVVNVIDRNMSAAEAVAAPVSIISGRGSCWSSRRCRTMSSAGWRRG
jgi:gamma-glutamyltranspeptidase/glutathione hydrolase